MKGEEQVFGKGASGALARPGERRKENGACSPKGKPSTATERPCGATDRVTQQEMQEVQERPAAMGKGKEKRLSL